MLSHILRRSTTHLHPRVSLSSLPTPFISQPLLKAYTTNSHPLRAQHHLWTDASKHGYGAVLDPATDGTAALDACFVSRSDAANRGCRGVFPSDNCYTYIHEAYAMLFMLDRKKERLRGTHAIARIDCDGAVHLIRRCLLRTKGVRRGDTAGNGGRSEGGGEVQSVGGGKGGGSRAIREANICSALMELVKAYDIELEVGWTSGEDNRLADMVSRAAGEQQRRHLPQGIRMRLLEGASAMA